MNKIKQSPTCCVICGKSYKTRTRLEKHLLLCELLKRTQNSSTIEQDDESDIPSQRKLYSILLELGYKYNKMEKKVEILNKILVKQKIKINVIDWLTNNIIPNVNIQHFHEHVFIIESDVEFIFHNSFYATLNVILMRVKTNDWPICGFIQKNNTLYSYDDNIWQELNQDMLYKFLNKIQMKISIKMLEWKKANNQDIKNNDTLATNYDKALVKLMEVDFSRETVFNKIKNMIFLLVKKSYDLEF
jgi:hypothetical protein